MMNIKKLTIPFLALLIFLTGCKTEQQSMIGFSLNNQIDSVSYSLGMNIASGIKSQGMDSVNQIALNKAFEDVFANKDKLITEENSQQLLNRYFQELAEQVGEINLKKGEAFLEKNKTKEGVFTTASGLQYKIIGKGSGPKPALTDQVTTHYKGITIEGETFDSSLDRGEPATFAVNGLIKGWTEALQLMSVGSKWQLFVPSDLAYGQNGAGAKIGPNSVLIFELELLGIN